MEEGYVIKESTQKGILKEGWVEMLTARQYCRQATPSAF